MDSLYYYNDILAARIRLDFKRALYSKINWGHRMIALSGARGVGKTTLMLQRQKEFVGLGPHSLYIAMDHPYFYNQTLFDLADEFYRSGGRFLFVDEVHKYAKWSNELKAVYDMFPQLNVVFSASSALDIYRGEADLSRRVFTYHLPGMSFREYLSFAYNVHHGVVSFEDLLSNHRQIANELVNTESDLHMLPTFKSYLKVGYYPFSAEQGTEDYIVKLGQVINTILDTDMAYADGYSPATAIRLKKLLSVLAESVPFQPNVAELARKLGITRDSIYQYLKYLEKALLLLALHAKGKGISLLQKPEKLYLENTNLAYALKASPDAGSIRETFLFNQLVNAGIETYYPKTGDFLVYDTILEVGGRKKGNQQLDVGKAGYIVSDDLLTGAGNKIPLWLFGFLY